MTNENLQYAMGNAPAVQRKGMTMRDAENWEEDHADPQDDPANAATHNDDTNNGNEDPYKKRYDDLKKHYDKTVAEKKTKERNEEELLNTVAELQTKLKEASRPTMPSTDAEIDEWKGNFPKVYDIVTTIVRKEKQGEIDELLGKINQLEGAIGSYARLQGRVELRKYHPDAEEIEKSPAFEAWLDAQRPAIQQLARGTVEDVKELLDIYKDKMGLTAAAQRQHNKEASRAVPTNSNANIPGEKKIWKESDLMKITNPRALEKALEEFDKARSEGRVEYDLSTNI